MKIHIFKPMLAVVVSLLFGASTSAFAQGIVSGKVLEGEEPLYGVSVAVEQSGTGGVTDFDGNYTIYLEPGTYRLTASYVGFTPVTRSVTVIEGETVFLDFDMSAGIVTDEIVVLGTRTNSRTTLDSPVPVDVIDLKKLTSTAPQTSVNQLLHYTTPSFQSNTQTISDGTDHIDPASLRGLGPDQVLVLINGKRRHNTSLVNTNGTFGRGNVGTDLNAIPASAIKKIEVLRDGAAAQYGSDAIAGVINVVLRDDVEALNVNVTTGANFTDGIGAFEGELKDYDGEVFNVGANYGIPIGNDGGFLNVTGEFNYRGSTNRMKEFTGSIFSGFNAIERFAAADGLDVNAMNMGGLQSYALIVDYFDDDLITALSLSNTEAEMAAAFDNWQNPFEEGTEEYDEYAFDYTDLELAARGLSRSDFNMRVGQSELRGGQSFANLSIPFGDNAEVYAFGGFGYRRGTSGCFYRLPGQARTLTSIYPNGTVPKINSDIKDQSIGVGVRGMVGSWNSDFSVVSGKNEFLFHMTDTHNATLGTSSPTSFDAGGHDFSQTTGNLDFSRYLDGALGLAGINFAFGGEYRFENFGVTPGSEFSYGRYDLNGNLVNPTTPDSLIVTDAAGVARPSGAQCFAGFLPSNVVDAKRSSAGVYGDVEIDVTDNFLLEGAIRFEDYSDFGSTLNYKGAARFNLLNNLVLRGAVSTGFRAPSLHQIHYSRTSTIFTLVDGVSIPQEVGIFANTSRAANLLGIPELKEETSVNFSAGFTAKVPALNIRLAVDAYQVNIDDRIILTGQFAPGENEELQNIFDQAGATAAAFFANTINTESRGIDVVLSHTGSLGNNSRISTDIAGTYTQTKWDRDDGINASPQLIEAGLVGTYFDQTSRLYLEQAVPRIKVTMGNTLTLGPVDIYLRNTYFGETTEATNEAIFNSDLELLSDAGIDPYNDGKIITDLSLGFDLSENFTVTVGSNNLLDVYPDEVDPRFSSSGRFIYSRRSPQFSYGGRHIFARINFTIK